MHELVVEEYLLLMNLSIDTLIEVKLPLSLVKNQVLFWGDNTPPMHLLTTVVHILSDAKNFTGDNF